MSQEEYVTSYILCFCVTVQTLESVRNGVPNIGFE